MLSASAPAGLADATITPAPNATTKNSAVARVRIGECTRPRSRGTRSRPCRLRRVARSVPHPTWPTGRTALAPIAAVVAARKLLNELRISDLVFTSAVAGGAHFLDVEAGLLHDCQRNERHVRREIPNDRALCISDGEHR